MAPRSHGAADYAALSVELFGPSEATAEPAPEMLEISGRPPTGMGIDAAEVETAPETTPAAFQDEAPRTGPVSVEPFRPETLVASALLGRVGDHGAW